MLTAQPFYITGIEDEEKAKSSAFGAFLMFMAVFGLSAYGMYYDSNLKPSHGIDENGMTNGDSAYHLSGDGDDFPNYGTST